MRVWYGPCFRCRLMLSIRSPFVLAIALTACGQAEELNRLQMRQKPLIRRSRRVVEFVHDNYIEMRRIYRLHATCAERLDRGEHVVENSRPMDAYPKLTEATLAQRMPEGRPALGKNLFSMCDEEDAVT